VLGALGIPTAPLPPQVNEFRFTYPPTGGSTAYVGQGGTFSFTVTDTISFEIVVSRDGVNFDPALPANRVLTGQSGTGSYSIVWDGRDNAGNNFPPVRATVSGSWAATVRRTSPSPTSRAISTAAPRSRS
jgi:hypothetical protein